MSPLSTILKTPFSIGTRIFVFHLPHLKNFDLKVNLSCSITMSSPVFFVINSSINSSAALFLSLAKLSLSFAEYFIMPWKPTWIKNKYYLLQYFLKYTTSKLFKPHTFIFYTRGYRNFFQHKIKSNLREMRSFV